MANRGQRNVKSSLNFFTKRPHLNPIQRRGSALFLKVLYFREDLIRLYQTDQDSLPW